MRFALPVVPAGLPAIAGRGGPVTPCYGNLVPVTDSSQQVAIISACSGYGGLDEAVKAATGGVVVAHIEYDEAPSKILEHRYPGIPNYGDLTTADWPGIVDSCVPAGARLVLTAGYPCQPFSSAGKRRGTDDHRHLWPYLAEAIRQIRPELVVFENVRNHLNLGFDVVLGELAEIGYDVTWTLLRASDVGAPHGRARLFIVGRRKVAAAPDRVPLARIDGEGGWAEPSDGLFGEIPWAGKIPVTGRVVAGGMYPFSLPDHLDEIAVRADAEEDNPFADMLPTPRGAAVRTSRKALTASGQWSAPSLEQSLELARGELPREYESWEEVRGRSAAMEPKLLATPDAGVFNDGQDVEVWKERNAREREKGYNGNGGGVPLAMQVRLLPTPEAKLSDSGPDYARAERDGSGGDDLTTTVFRAFINDEDNPDRLLLPTPVVGDTWGSQGPDDPEEWEAWKQERADRGIPTGQGMLSTAVRTLLPSPTASDGERTTDSYGRGNPTLGGALLPSPTAALASGGQTSRSGDRSGEMLLSGIAEAAAGGKLLPTPTCQDGSNNAGPSQFDRNSLPLNTLVTTLLPTPEASDGSGGRLTTERGGKRPSGSKRSVYLATAVAHDIVHAQVEDEEPQTMLHVVADPIEDAEEGLLPTPRATDGTKGGPNQRGSSGDLMLPSAVTPLAPVDGGLLPSPVSSDAIGSRNSTCYRGPGAGDNNAGETLTDVMWQAAGAEGPTKGTDAPVYTEITDWGPYAAAVARWAAVVGPAPAPTEPNSKGKQRLAPAFPEWMMGLPSGWVTEVPGISRNEKLKAIGNGVCPQQGYVAVSRQLAALPW